MDRHKSPRRRRIWSILARILIIAVTIIAAIAIVGFAFRIFGSFTKPALVSVSGANCSGSTDLECTLSLTNSGTSSARVESGTITYGGGTYIASAVGGQTTIAPGNSAATTLTFSGHAAGPDGSPFTGSVTLSNGFSVPYAGDF